ncbi:MAG: purine-nucleoside phosphorylase [Ardenticatenales bacterium]|nr:purine-nucleoside phosphorylase [Ardenticatenales bacterium]
MRDQARAAAEAMRAILSDLPPARTALITGSGLGALADSVEGALRFPTRELPHWPVSTVEGHAGQIVSGTLAGLPIVVMQGRVHFYEGYTIQAVTFPIRVLQAYGIERLIVTNAAGGLETSWQAGDIMLISDHINLPGMTGNNPLMGPNDDRLGTRFPPMENAYNPRLRALTRQVAAAQGLTLREGVYVMVSGPSFETAAELRFLKAIGGQAVGMSTAPEVVVARHAGIEVLGLSLITNIARLNPAPDELTSHEEVLETGTHAAPRMVSLLQGVLSALGSD